MINFLRTLFSSSVLICSLIAWIRSLYHLAFDNYGYVTVFSMFVTAGVTISETLWQKTIFGTTYFILLLVLGTVLLNTATGIHKNNLKAAIFFARAQRHEYGTPKYNINIVKWDNHKFKKGKFLFVGFKFLIFMLYLVTANALMTDGSSLNGEDVPWQIKVLELSTEIIIRVPIALFWYYEFKSIGENSTYIYGKKAKIFTIVEGIFEPRIFKFFGSKTPTDGINKDVKIDPEDYGLNDEILRDFRDKETDTHDQPKDNPGT